MGATSNLHVWDPQQERFVLRTVDQEKHGILLIVGKDETITHRLGPFISFPKLPNTDNFQFSLSILDNRNAFETPGSSREVVGQEVDPTTSLLVSSI